MSYLILFGICLAFTLLFVPWASNVGYRLGIIDSPDGNLKFHIGNIPRTGGLAMVAAFAIGIAVHEPLGVDSPMEWALFVCLAALVALGFADDRVGVGSTTRLFFQFGILVPVVWSGMSFEFFGSRLADGVVTLIWLVGVTNAANLIDIMDGLAATFGFFASIVFVAMGTIVDAPFVVLLSTILAACTLGFLRYNLVNARIFMGEVGSTFIGFLTGSIAVMLSTAIKGNTINSVAPLLVMWVPLFEVAFVSVVRLKKRHSPFSGSRDHVAHRLLDNGIPPLAIVACAAAVTACLGLITLAALEASSWIFAALVITVGTMSLFVATILFPRGSAREDALPSEDRASESPPAQKKVAAPCAVAGDQGLE